MPETSLATTIPTTNATTYLYWPSGENVPLPMLATDGRNWQMYKERFYLSAVARGLKGHLTGTKPRPADEDARFEAWEIAEAVLKLRMAESMPYSIYGQIKGNKTVKEAYDALGQLFEHPSYTLVRVIDLRRKIARTRCEEGCDLRLHFSRMMGMREELASLGSNISETDFVLMLMNSVPASFDTSFNPITGSITLHEFTSRTLDEFDRRSLTATKRSGGKARDQALLAHDEKDAKKRVECSNCCKKGHRKADCRVKGGGREGQGSKSRKTSESARTAEDDDSDGVWMAHIDDATLADPPPNHIYTW